MRKQGSQNDQWIELYKNCTSIISKSEIDLLTIKAIKEIRSVIKKYGFKKIGYAWSGGKDSIVLLDIIRKSGIDVFGGFSVIHQNEFPQFERWLYDNAPNDLEFMYSEAMSLEWFNDNIEVLFPMTTKNKSKFTPVWRKEQAEWFLKNDIDVLLLGRRKEDGNICKKNKYGDYIATNKKGIVKFDVIAEWNHEQTLAYIKYNDLKLPPIYQYPNGWLFGTHPWTERRRLNGYYFETFDEIMNIDKSILLNARGRLNILDDYFKYKEKGEGEKK